MSGPPAFSYTPAPHERVRYTQLLLDVGSARLDFAPGGGLLIILLLAALLIISCSFKICVYNRRIMVHSSKRPTRNGRVPLAVRTPSSFLPGPSCPWNN
jgi:hypothetical protein